VAGHHRPECGGKAWLCWQGRDQPASEGGQAQRGISRLRRASVCRADPTRCDRIAECYTSCSGRLQGTEILRIAEAVLPPGTGFLPPETELTTGPPRDIVSLSRTRRRSTQQHSGRQVSRIVDSPVRACSSYFCRQIAPLWAFEAQIGRAGFSSTRETPFNSGLYQYWCRMMDLVEIDLATNAARMFWTRWI
jgi:hypothetical protein